MFIKVAKHVNWRGKACGNNLRKDTNEDMFSWPDSPDPGDSPTALSMLLRNDLTGNKAAFSVWHLDGSLQNINTVPINGP